MPKYKVKTDEFEIVFRPISAEESDRFFYILKTKDNAEVEEALFKTISDLNDIDVDSLPAGVIPTVLYCAFKVSGYFSKELDIPDKIDEFRKSIDNSLFFKMYSAIIKAQPGYNLDMLKAKSLNELLELFALSEDILEQKIFDTSKMRKSLSEEKTSNKNAGGIQNITNEEIDLVKAMIEAEEIRKEMF